MTKIDKIHEKYKNRNPNNPWPPEAVLKDVSLIVDILGRFMAITIDRIKEINCPPDVNSEECSMTTCDDCVKGYLFGDMLKEEK